MRNYNNKSNRKLPKFLKKSEVEDLLENALNEKYEHYLMILTIWRSGIRVSELTDLTPADIDLEKNRIEVREGKGDKDRVIPLHPELKREIKSYMDIKELKTDDKIFDYSSRWVQKIIKKYAPEGKNWIHPHTLRHSFAVHVIDSGLDSRKLQKMLGHSSLQTTEIYLDLTARQVVKDFLDKVD